MLPDCSKFPNRNFQMFGYVFHDILGKPNSCGKLKTLWYFLNEIFTELGMYVRSSKTGFVSVTICGWHQDGGEKAEYGCHVEEFDEKCGYWRNHISSWSHTFGMHSTWMQTNETIIEQNTNMFESRILAGATENYRGGGILHTDGSVATWRACSKLCWTILWIGKQESGAILQKFRIFVWMIINDNRRNWNQLENCQKFVRKLFGNASIWHELDDVTSCGQWTSLQRSVTNWIRACDKRLARLISYLHHTNDCRQCCHVGNTAQHCRLGLFQDSVFVGDVEDSKSISGGVLRILGSRTFVTILKNRFQRESCAYLEVKRSCQSVGCARNKLQFRTVLQNLKSFLWMLDYVWMGYLLLIFGLQ